MKLSDAMKIIELAEMGFAIHFEKREGGVLGADYFPDKSEGLIKSEKEAWLLAERFAKSTGEDHVNIFVVDKDYRPVAGYSEKTIRKY